MIKKYAIIVAGGVGSRSGDSLPKQFHMIGEHPMLWWTLKAFHDENPDTRLIVVMHPDYINFWKKTAGTDCAPHKTTPGGDSRTASVAAGLLLIEGEEGLVAIHDAARPMVSARLISEGWKTASEHKTAIPALPVAESLREGTTEKSHSVDRSLYFSVQTPQVFDIALLKNAYNASKTAKGVVFTDDASVVEWHGTPVRLYPGESRNIKVTYPDDFRIAESFLKI